MRLLLPLLYMLSILTKIAEASEPAMSFMEYLDQNHLVGLRWGFDLLQGSIAFRLAVNTTGWVGFGFSRSGGIKGSVIVIGGLGPSVKLLHSKTLLDIKILYHLVYFCFDVFTNNNKTISSV